MTFDRLTFARRLKTAGFTEAQAEALADANRDMLVRDLATKDDLKSEVGLLRTELTSGFVAVRGEFKSEIASVRGDVAAVELRLQAAIEGLGLRLTIRLGVIIGAAIAILGTILRLH